MQAAAASRSAHEFWSMQDRVIAPLKNGRHEDDRRKIKCRVGRIAARGIGSAMGYKRVKMSPRRIIPLLLAMTLLAAGGALADRRASGSWVEALGLSRGAEVRDVAWLHGCSFLFTRSGGRDDWDPILTGGDVDDRVVPARVGDG